MKVRMLATRIQEWLSGPKPPPCRRDPLKTEEVKQSFDRLEHEFEILKLVSENVKRETEKTQ